MKVTCSIIIPLGRPDQAASVVFHLLEQKINSVDYEIVLVTAQPTKLKNFTSERVLVISVEELYPPGKMRNIGAKESRGEYLFFIDDDCLAPPTWLEKMLKPFYCDRRIGAVGCQVTSHGSGFWARCADYALFGAYQYDRYTKRDIGSAALSVRRKAFEEAGGFEETLFASEDWDFNYRLEKKGWRRVFDPSIRVFHNHGRASLKAILKQAYQSGAYSGLVVQNTHKEMKKGSFLVRLSILMNSPTFYFFLILPYAFAVAVQQIIEQRNTDPKFPYFIPFIVMARCCYHIGVWHRLVKDKR